MEFLIIWITLCSFMLYEISVMILRFLYIVTQDSIAMNKYSRK